jgi:hypothetical protein
MNQSDKSQIEASNASRSTKSITVKDSAHTVSQVEVEAFLKLLATIAKRILNEEVQPDTEQKAS